MKLDRTELIRLIEARPSEGFMRSTPRGDWFMVVLGSILSLIMVVTIGFYAKMFLTVGKGSALGLLVFLLFIGLLMVGIGLWNLSNRTLYNELKDRYWSQIQPQDLVEALHFTSRWKAGLAIANELYVPNKRVGFGMVWLAGKCGHRRFAESYRVLTRMEDGDAVLHHMRLAENRLRGAFALFGLWYLPYAVFSRGGQWISEMIWGDPAVAAANRWVVELVLSIGFLSWLGAAFWRYYRLGPDEMECFPYLDRLSDRDLSTLADPGRLGRIARLVQRDRNRVQVPN